MRILAVQTGPLARLHGGTPHPACAAEAASARRRPGPLPFRLAALSRRRSGRGEGEASFSVVHVADGLNTWAKQGKCLLSPALSSKGGEGDGGPRNSHPNSMAVRRGSLPFVAARFCRAFTLIEVMIACGIFFMATFGILALVSTTLRNARALQRSEVDAGMAAAQVYQTLRTNRQTEVSGSGDFGEAYPGYSYKFAGQEYQSNGLLQVDIVVNRRGLGKPVDALSIWVYNPDAKSGLGQPTFR
jgi:type II secretory pathway pseudopilin PulG